MVQTTNDIIRALEVNQDESVSKLIRDLIKEHIAGPGHKAWQYWRRYKLEDAGIYHREPANYEKVDRKTASDFFADIVDTKTGYMGNEITVSLDKNAYLDEAGVLREAEYQGKTDKLKEFQRDNYTEDANSELLREACATGCGYRLLYSNDNEVRIKNLPNWEVIYIYDQSIDEPQLALRYYEVIDKSDGQNKSRTVVEWYNDHEVRYYIDNGKYDFEPDYSRVEGGVQPHLFNGIPIIPFPNNSIEFPEPAKAIDLMDAYDAIISSTTSEIEQLRMAYMFIKSSGLDVDDEFMKRLEQTGIFPLDAEGDVGFINKQLADKPVQNILAEIRRNIYQFSKSIDMSKDFGGEMRVIGWQVALLNLENSCKITERKFKHSFRKQYQLITDYWRTYNGVDIDPNDLEFTFTRNFPRDLHAEAETLQLLLGTVSKKTAFGQMSFIDDPDDEIMRIEEEGDPYRSIDGNTGFSEEQPEDNEGRGQDT